MAICLPGMASRVKRAPTSATREAPLVTTTNWMTTRIRNTTSPTTTEPPTTNEPNDWITPPAEPVVRISRVDDTLRARRNRVAISSSDGKAARSRARAVMMVVNSIRTPKAMLNDSSRSSSIPGRGTTMRAMTAIMPPASRPPPRLVGSIGLPSAHPNRL